MLRARLVLTLLALPMPALAMQALDDDALGSIAGADGITLSIGQNSDMTADRVSWVTDDNGLDNFSCSGGTTNQHACTLINDIRLGGANGSGSWSSSIDIDAATDAGGNGMIGLSGSWTPQRLVLGGVTLNTASQDASASSLGSFAIQSQGSFTYANRGLFYSGANTAHLDVNASGDVFYRQGAAGSAELSFADFLLDMGFTSGAAGGHLSSTGEVGIDNSGIFLQAPFMRADIDFDLAFKAVAGDFDVTGRSKLLHFGWHGGLVNPLWRIGAGGFGYGTYLDGANSFQDFNGSQGGTARSQGINLLTQWDFDSDFRLDIGEAGGNGTVASLSNWTRLGSAPGPMFSFPVIFDVLQGGAGPAGLCAGGFTSGVPADAVSCTGAGGEWISSDGPGANEAAFAALIRDARLLAYGSQITVTDPAAGGTVTPINWGLAFTYGKLDADIFLYPEGRADGAAVSTINTGLRADITLLAQSPDAWRRANSNDAAVRSTAGNGWQTNTHFMLVDTAASGGSGHTGVGFMNGDILYRARDLYLRVTDGDSGYPDLPGGLWLQTDNLAQYRFRAIFGGGDMADLSYDSTVKISLMDVNLSTDRFLFALNPLPVDTDTGAAPIGFNGLLNFDGTASMTYGEVSSPDSKFYVNDVSGTIAWRNGELSLVSGQNTTDGLPQFAIRNDLMLGESAHFGGDSANLAQPLVGTVGFGTEDFGRVAFPAGTWNSEIIVKIPN